MCQRFEIFFQIFFPPRSTYLIEQVESIRQLAEEATGTEQMADVDGPSWRKIKCKSMQLMY